MGAKPFNLHAHPPPEKGIRVQTCHRVSSKSTAPPGNPVSGCVGTMRMSIHPISMMSAFPLEREPRGCITRVPSLPNTDWIGICRGHSDHRVQLLPHDTPVWLRSSPRPGSFPQLILLFLHFPSQASVAWELCGEWQCFSNFIAHTKLIPAHLGKMQVGIEQVGAVGFCISDKLSGDATLWPIGHTLGTRKVEEE